MAAEGSTPLTSEQFRALCLRMPLAVEGEHMSHADFRVRGKIFATLPPADAQRRRWGVLKLTPDQQAGWMKHQPDAWVPAAGQWGARGYTRVLLSRVRTADAAAAVLAAWRNTAPAKLVAEFE
jgi:hypothetical protein